jgi:hypothetical protein
MLHDLSQNQPELANSPLEVENLNPEVTRDLITRHFVETQIKDGQQPNYIQF